MKDITGMPIELGDTILKPTTCTGLVFTVVTLENIHHMQNYICVVVKKVDGRKILNADFITDKNGKLTVSAYGELKNSPEDEVEGRRRL